ncbi:unnamed protein product [Meganyctiphanes norvegica]|uniref:Phospholipid-transporting ATPase n=1 Tax=Meganyctiphanes norvegica TaxID=48144 RepID=A0AAV2REB1_MEGNR
MSGVGGGGGGGGDGVAHNTHSSYSGNTSSNNSTGYGRGGHVSSNNNGAAYTGGGGAGGAGPGAGPGQDVVGGGPPAGLPPIPQPRQRGHARSVSHGGGIMIHRDPPPYDHGGPIGGFNMGGGVGGLGVNSGTNQHLANVARGHQRTFSHGQIVDGGRGGRGHRRNVSKTDFILPDGHEQREKQREQEQKHKSLTRTSSFPKGHSRQASRTESIYTIRNHKRTLLQKLMFWKKVHEESRTRVVVPNHVVPPHVSPNQHPNGGYPSNRICTTKYTLLSFLPKNLFEQFHRFANLYFLFIVLLNFVPAVEAFGKEISMLPLIFVLGITAIKDLFEDRRRYNSDKKVNNAHCRVYSSEQRRYVKCLRKDIRVGDIVHLSVNEIIPADMVMLNSSDEQGTCFIESSNLDGESNLKQRQCIKGIGMDDKFEVLKFDYMMEIGAPTTKMYHFTGSIPLPSGERVPLTKDNLLLRECVMKNTDFVEGIVVYAGCETKAMLNNGGTRYKRSMLERLMNTEVMWCVVILIVMCLISAAGAGIWQSYYGRDAAKGLVPFIPPSDLGIGLRSVEASSIWVGFVTFWTFIIIYQVIIPISLYVTIELIKLAIIYHVHKDPDFEDKRTGMTIECRALNIPEELGQVQYVFTDKTGTLTENNMVFQRCSINGTDYAHTPVITSSADERDTFIVNNQLKEELDSLELPLIYAQPGSRQNPSNCITRDANSQLYTDFFFILAACNTVIVAKNPHHDTMNASGVIIPREERADLSSISEVDNASFNTSTTSLNTSWGPRGLLKGLISISRPLSPIASSPRSTPPHTPEGSPRYSTYPAFDSPPHTAEKSSVSITLNPLNQSHNSSNGLIPMSSPRLQITPSRPTNLNLAPHTYLKDNSTPTPSPMDMKPLYEAESPDELALVDTAYKYGCKLLRRNLHNVMLTLPGHGVCEYEILHVLPFDSTRKRMSIIVRHPETGEKILYCKGADSAILDNLSRNVDDATKFRIFKTQQQLNNYSKQGLRVLCMAKRILTDTEYEDWAILQKEAENSLSAREHKLSESYERIEKNLKLVGATGIEDRLQDGVPETIQALRSAGIVVWVLTGDKQETAINIAYSASLFATDMEIIKLNARTKDQAESTIQYYLGKIEQAEANYSRARMAANGEAAQTGFSNLQHAPNSSSQPPKERGLVVDGRTLVFILDRRANLKHAFLELASKCSAVLCCRATPLQKAFIVRCAKDTLKVMTLAVGDGANDVSMIQTADVGIGISGVEGRQAVMASDYAITRFKHLQKLMLVHGHWSYDKLSRVILYFFYKNSMFVFILLWYQLFAGWSGSIMVDPAYLMVFNFLFTSLPPIIMGIHDRNADAEILMAQPALYAQGRESRLYKPKYFWMNILDAVYQSIIVFFFAAVLYEDSDAGIYEFGLTICHACMVTQSLHIAIETTSWTVIHIFSFALSYIVFFAFGALYTMTCVGCFGGVSLYGELAHAVSTPLHWLTILLTSVLAVLPRFIILALRSSLMPSDIQQAVLSDKAKNPRRQNPFMVSWSRSTSASSVYRGGYNEEDGDGASEPLSSMITTTTILNTTDEAHV